MKLVLKTKNTKFNQKQLMKIILTYYWTQTVEN